MRLEYKESSWAFVFFIMQFSEVLIMNEKEYFDLVEKTIKQRASKKKSQGITTLDEYFDLLKNEK